MSSAYIPTIGIEIHTQLATKSKMFCACDNDSINAKPNTNVCPVCLAMPGSLPTINKGAVELAIKLGYGLNAKIAEHTNFDRKNYFYPDSPKGYQITQMDQPIIQQGHVEILVDGEFRRIGIHHAHLEEDAGKLTHPVGADYSLVDFNRAGTPLIEIVSDPDMHTPTEARRYLQEVYAIACALGVTHGNLQHGNFKFDLNVSVSRDPKVLGTRTELKNLNSFRNAERALSYEIERQIVELENGREVPQETRGYDDSRNITFSQRGKENAHDYRYFPEPDLPPLVLNNNLIESTTKESKNTTLPITIRKELIDVGLSLDEQDILIGQPSTATLFASARKLLADKKQQRTAINLLIGEYQAWLTENSEADSNLTGRALADLVSYVADSTISLSAAKEIFGQVIKGDDPSEIISSQGLSQISDDSQLKGIIEELMIANPNAVADYKSGNTKAAGFFVGQVMQATKGQANPQKTQALVVELLEGN